MHGAVLFDLYGTLVDLKTDENDPRLWQGLYDWARVNLSTPPDTALLLHEDYVRLCEENAKIYGDGFILSRVFSELLGPDISKEQITSFANEFRKLSIRSLKLRQYAIPVLSKLRELDGVGLGLVSNTEALFTNYDIDRLGIRQFFDVIILSSEVGVAKPNPRILNEALWNLGVRPERAVFIGDTPETDMMAAKALGMPCIIITEDMNQQSSVTGQLVRLVSPSPESVYAQIIRLLNR